MTGTTRRRALLGGGYLVGTLAAGAGAAGRWMATDLAWRSRVWLSSVADVDERRDAIGEVALLLMAFGLGLLLLCFRHHLTRAPEPPAGGRGFEPLAPPKAVVANDVAPESRRGVE